MSKKTRLPKGLVAARVNPSSFNEKDRTMEVVWSTGQSVRRFDYNTGEFYNEVLLMGAENVRLERMNAGAPVLDTHAQGQLSNQLGVVLDASLINGSGVARIKLSEREEISGIIGDIRDGIIKNISVGYKIHKVEEVRDEEKGISTYTVVDWTPLEISFVPVPADYKAQARSENEVQSFDCEIITSIKGDSMLKELEKEIQRNEEEVATNEAEVTETETDESKEEVSTEEEAKTEEVEAEKEVEEKEEEVKEEESEEEDAVEVETKRCSEIISLCTKHEVNAEKRNEFISARSSVEEVSAFILKAQEKREEEKTTSNNLEIEVMSDNKQKRNECVARGLLHAGNPQKFKLEDGDKTYFTGSPLDAARSYLHREENVKDAYRMNKEEVVKRALHHSSDFGSILQDSCNKSLMMGYTEASSNYELFLRDRIANDFKSMSTHRISSGGNLKKVNEHGEYKRATLDETGEEYSIHTYGEIIGLTRKLLINDDLNAFTILPAEMGRKIMRTERDMFWALIGQPQVMSDNLALFHANHGNLAATGAIIDDNSVSDARKAMRQQKDISGQKLHIQPKYVVVGTEREQEALKALAMVQPSNAGDVSTIAGTMQVLVEPCLDDYHVSNVHPWFLFGDLAQGPMAERARLGGQGPQIFVREGFDIDGLETKIRYEFGMKVIDYRQFYKNPGV